MYEFPTNRKERKRERERKKGEINEERVTDTLLFHRETQSDDKKKAAALMNRTVYSLSRKLPREFFRIRDSRPCDL